jgi:hypothetical protein
MVSEPDDTFSEPGDTVFSEPGDTVFSEPDDMFLILSPPPHLVNRLLAQTLSGPLDHVKKSRLKIRLSLFVIDIPRGYRDP